MSRLRAGGESELSLLFFLSRYLCPRAGSSPIVAVRVVSALTDSAYIPCSSTHIIKSGLPGSPGSRAYYYYNSARRFRPDATATFLLLSLPTRLYRESRLVSYYRMRSTYTSALPLAFARTVRSIACYASLGVALGVRVPTGVATQLSSQLHPLSSRRSIHCHVHLLVSLLVRLIAHVLVSLLVRLIAHLGGDLGCGLGGRALRLRL